MTLCVAAAVALTAVPGSVCAYATSQNYVYDIASGELYDHISHKKVAEEFETMENKV